MDTRRSVRWLVRCVVVAALGLGSLGVGAAPALTDTGSRSAATQDTKQAGPSNKSGLRYETGWG